MTSTMAAVAASQASLRRVTNERSKTSASYKSYLPVRLSIIDKKRNGGEQAARSGDEIKHSNALLGFLLGAVVAAAIAVAVVGTGGLAAALIVGAAVTGGSMLGQWLGSMVPGSVTGKLSTGSGAPGAKPVSTGTTTQRDGITNTRNAGLPAARAATPPPPPPGWFQRLMHKSWLGSGIAAIAGGAVGIWNGGFVAGACAAVTAASKHMSQDDLPSKKQSQEQYETALAEAGDSASFDTAACSKESVPPRVGQGSETVFINGQPAARKGDQVECGAKISQGSSNVFIGGPQGTTLEIDDEIPLWAEIVSMLIPPGAGLVKFGTQFAKIMMRGGIRNALRFAAVKALGRGAITCSRGYRGIRGFVCRFLGDPVNPQNGSVVDERTDINLPAPLPLTFTRHYSSVGHHHGMLGPNWMDNWSEHLEIRGEETWFRREDGSVVIFHTPFESGIGEHLVFKALLLIKNRDVYIIYDLKSRVSKHFEKKTGDIFHLTKITDAHDNWQKFAWSDGGKLLEVQDNTGQVLRLEHTSRLICVDHHYENQKTRLVTYSLDTHGRLEKVEGIENGTFFYGYDQHNRMAWWGDTRAVLAQFSYDAEGRCAAVKDAEGYYDCRFEYQPEKNRTLYHTKEGTSIFEFDENGNVISETDPLGNIKQSILDHDQNVVAEIDALGRKTEFTYDHLNNLTSIVLPDGQTTRLTYNEFDIVQVVNPTGETTRYAHNEAGDVVKIDAPHDQYLSILHDERGLPVRILDHLGRKTQFAYDKRGLPIGYTDPLVQTTAFEYDVLGTQTAVIAPDGSRTTFETSDKAGRLSKNVSKIMLPGGEVTHLGYDSEGLLSTHIDGEGRKSEYKYGAFDLLSEIIHPGGEKLSFLYGLETRLERVINAVGEQYRYVYDAAGNVVEEIDFAGHKTRYAHDPCGNIIEKIAPDGTRTTYTHDVMDRLVSTNVYDGKPDANGKPTPGSFVHYTYNDKGQIVAVENNHACIKYTYDSQGNIVEENHNGQVTKFAYDPDTGQRTQRTTPSGQGSVYGWDMLNRLTSFQVEGHGKIDFTLNKKGQEITRVSDRGFAETRAYTPSGLLKEQWAGRYSGEKGKILETLNVAHKGVIHQQTRRNYQWNRAHNLTGIIDDRWGKTQYTYNTNSQIIAASHGGLPIGGESAVKTECFTYDKRHNIASQSKIMAQWIGESGTGETPFSGDHHYRRGGLVEDFIISPHTRVKYRYDACGRVVEKTEYRKGFRPKTTHLEWNGFNQLVAITDPDGQIAHYMY